MSEEAKKTIEEQFNEGSIDQIMKEWHTNYTPTDMWTEDEKAAWGKLTNDLLKSLKEAAKFEEYGAIVAKAMIGLRDLGVSVVKAFAERSRIKTMETILRRLRVENIGTALFRNKDNAYINEIVKNGRLVKSAKKKK